MSIRSAEGRSEVKPNVGTLIVAAQIRHLTSRAGNAVPAGNISDEHGLKGRGSNDDWNIPCLGVFGKTYFYQDGIQAVPLERCTQLNVIPSCAHDTEAIEYLGKS